MTDKGRHVPVLFKEVLDYLPSSPRTLLDGTIGDGGHTERITQHKKLDHVYAFDRDPQAIKRAQDLLKNNTTPKTFFTSSYEFASDELNALGVNTVDCILLDLGFSSPQLVQGRGFSFQEEAPLDMRYDQSQELTAREVINVWSQGDIEKIFREYGEERNAYGLASAVVSARKAKAIETTQDLVEIITDWYRKKLHSKKEVPWIGGIHPATRIFQSLRIAVNDEYGTIRRSLPKLISLLSSHGRILILTFHSGEDRIVKQYFKYESSTCVCPPKYPKCICNHTPSLTIITKKPIGPTDDEITRNPKSRSAKLRVAEKL